MATEISQPEVLLQLTELCQELKNWFERGKYAGTYSIRDGGLTADFLRDGQYYRITGSLFSDGVHLYGDRTDYMPDEDFVGEIWSMAVPAAVVKLANRIAVWREKYEDPESAAMSPYMEESFGGYSYSKGSMFTGSGQSGVSNWKDVFSRSLSPWRKLR